MNNKYQDYILKGYIIFALMILCFGCKDKTKYNNGDQLRDSIVHFLNEQNYQLIDTNIIETIVTKRMLVSPLFFDVSLNDICDSTRVVNIINNSLIVKNKFFHEATSESSSCVLVLNVNSITNSENAQYLFSTMKKLEGMNHYLFGSYLHEQAIGFCMDNYIVFIVNRCYENPINTKQLLKSLNIDTDNFKDYIEWNQLDSGLHYMSN